MASPTGTASSTAEELDHAEDMIQYVIRRRSGEDPGYPRSRHRVRLRTADRRESPYTHECYVSEKIEELVRIAAEEKDIAFAGLLLKYIREQVEEEATATSIVDRVRLASDHDHLPRQGAQHTLRHSTLIDNPYRGLCCGYLQCSPLSIR